MDDLHHSERRLGLALQRLEHSDVSRANQAKIKEFLDVLRAEGIGSLRITKYLHHLITLSELLRKPFASTTKKDLQRVMAQIESKDYEEWTKHDYKVIVKRFYKWLRDVEEGYPEEVRWIKTAMKENNHKLPESLLTEDEIKRFAEAAGNSRDKALILCLYESGCRVGELLTLKIRSVQFDEYGAVLMVHGKTGDRRVRIIASAPALAQWMQDHPQKENPEAFLWIGLWTKNYGEPLEYYAFRKQLSKIAERAGIKKKVHPHLFRHSRASHLAKVLTEAQMKQHFGWVQGSEMAATYVHLSGRDVDQALLKVAGIKTEESLQEPTFKVQECQRCHEKNSPDAKFCKRCATPLTLKIAMDTERSREEADKDMSKLLDDPEVQFLISRKLRELGLLEKLAKAP